MVFGGPYPGFSAPIGPGETDKAKIVAQHIKVWERPLMTSDFRVGRGVQNDPKNRTF